MTSRRSARPAVDFGNRAALLRVAAACPERYDRAMRVSRVLCFSIAREIVHYALLSFLALTAILLSQNALKRLEDLVAVGATLPEFFSVLAWMLPMLTAYTLPMAFLFGVVFTLGRMTAQGEIVAMGASGLGLGALLVPALLLGFVVSGISAYVMVDLEHRAHRELRQIVRTRIIRSRSGHS